MSLTIQQLNADTTFLLTFAPPFAPERLCKRFPGDYTILVDPWLKGASSIFHPTFQISHHTAKPALQSLEELDLTPDLIIISQDKPDHCHRETLCSLPKDTKIDILATPAAAKKIRSWQHFDHDIVHVLRPYNPREPDSVVRISLDGYSVATAEGEITIANVPAKRDVTGLHNAIGITYQAPATVLTRQARSSTNAMASTVSLQEQSGNAAKSSFTRSRSGKKDTSTRPAWFNNLRSSRSVPNLISSPSQAELPAASLSRVDSRLSRRASHLHKERTVSVLYTPHGVSTRTLEQYITHHLTPLSALPVSALFHSISVEQNPWFMGGIVARGAPGGVQISKQVMAQHWIRAHDELKDNRGVATMWIKSRRYQLEQVSEMLREVGLRETKLHQLGVGEILRVPELKKEEDCKNLYEACRVDMRGDEIPPVPPMPDLKGFQVDDSMTRRKKELSKFWTEFQGRVKT